MVNRLYRVLVRLDDAEQDAGTLELTGGEYGANRDADALSAALGELASIEGASLIQWRALAVPRERFRGLRVQLVSVWVSA